MLSIKLNKVVGDSMSPTIADDDYVVSVNCSWFKYRVNDIVICNHPEYQFIIKRIKKIDDKGDVLLVGDNKKSTDSNMIGWQPASTLQGKAYKWF